jgi:hypothetical protein
METELRVLQKFTKSVAELRVTGNRNLFTELRMKKIAVKTTQFQNEKKAKLDPP